MKQKDYAGYIGIDVSKAKLDIALDAQRVLSVDNQASGWEQLQQHLAPYSHHLLVLEASGGYEQAVAKWLQMKGFAVAIVNAKRVRDYAKSQGILAKTDRIDAKVIRSYGEISRPRSQRLRTEAEKELEGMIKRREQIVRLITIEKQHAEKTTGSPLLSVEKVLKGLKEALSELEKAIEKIIAQNESLKKKQVCLRAIKGIGQVSSCLLLAELPELGQVSSKAIAALSGVAPFNKESGHYQGKRRISGGRQAVRRVLYMATLTAVRYNESLKEFYERLIKKGKAAKVALTACMRKLVVHINAKLREMFEKNIECLN